MANNRNELNKNLAQMLKGGVIMDVTTPEQAKIAQDAGACAVMALERIPADIRAAGGVSRMSDPAMIKGIQEAVSIPVMAKVRIGHVAEARILQAIEIDYIDESEVLSPADDVYHIDKNQFDVPFVCGAKNLGEALRRIAEGAAMIRTKGEPGTGDVIQAVRHMRTMNKQIRELVSLRDDEVYEAAKMDRAGQVKTFFHVTIPMISPTLVVLITNNVTSSFCSFAIIDLMTKGGPKNSSNMMVYWIYENAFSYYRVGPAMAGAVVLLMLVGSISVLVFTISNRKAHY